MNAISKLHCSRCRKLLATISMFVRPKDSITVFCRECSDEMKVLAAQPNAGRLRKQPQWSST